jgi:hypothetical protein
VPDAVQHTGVVADSIETSASNLSKMTISFQIVMRAVEKLLSYVRNAQTHPDAQIARIAASIKESGWTSPILVDGRGTIIAVHARVVAARKLGIAEVPVIVLTHLAPAQKSAVRAC